MVKGAANSGRASCNPEFFLLGGSLETGCSDEVITQIRLSPPVRPRRFVPAGSSSVMVTSRLSPVPPGVVPFAFSPSPHFRLSAVGDLPLLCNVPQVRTSGGADCWARVVGVYFQHFKEIVVPPLRKQRGRGFPQEFQRLAEPFASHLGIEFLPSRAVGLVVRKET